MSHQTDAAAHYRHSSLRERIVEHVFIGDALREFWRLGVTNVEVLRSEFDAYGYDLVMSHQSVVRHIQFKASTRRRPYSISIARSLFEKPSGCVIWIGVTSDLAMGPFYWFGGSPGEVLPKLDVPKAAKGRRNMTGKRLDRPNHVYIPDSMFIRVDTLRELLLLLFDFEGSTSLP
jgi:hypothetical protein